MCVAPAVGQEACSYGYCDTNGVTTLNAPGICMNDHELAFNGEDCSKSGGLIRVALQAPSSL